MSDSMSRDKTKVIECSPSKIAVFRHPSISSIIIHHTYSAFSHTLHLCVGTFVTYHAGSKGKEVYRLVQGAGFHSDNSNSIAVFGNLIVELASQKSIKRK